MDRKRGKSRKCWLPAFSPFSTMFSRGIFYRVVKSRDCVYSVVKSRGKEFKLQYHDCIMDSVEKRSDCIFFVCRLVLIYSACKSYNSCEKQKIHVLVFDCRKLRNYRRSRHGTSRTKCL